MPKYMYLIRSPEPLSRQAFVSMIHDRLVPQLIELNPDKLKVSLTEISPPRFTILPLKKDNFALISVWGNLEGVLEQWQTATTGIGAKVAGYRVTEAIPVVYERDWADGTASPGVVLFTLLKKKLSISYEQFIERWLGKHTQLSLRIQPLWNYNRNVVDSEIIAGSQAYDGIVEEHFRSLRDITNPMRFFGGKLKMLPNMFRIQRDISKFLDISANECYLLTEYHIRS